MIVAEGAIGGDAEQRLGNELRDAVAAREAVVVDLAGVTALDAGALAAVLAAQRDASDAGVPFVAVVDAARAFEQRGDVNLTGLLDAVPHRETREQALAAVRSDG